MKNIERIKEVIKPRKLKEKKSVHRKLRFFLYIMGITITLLLWLYFNFGDEFLAIFQNESSEPSQQLLDNTAYFKITTEEVATRIKDKKEEFYANPFVNSVLIPLSLYTGKKFIDSIFIKLKLSET